MNKIPKKTFTYHSSKLFKKFYDNTDFLRKQERFFWERNTKMPIFFVNKAFYIHKGLYFRKKRIEYYHMSIPMGAFAFTRKPFTPPLKKEKNNKKKRIGKIKYEQSRFHGTIKNTLLVATEQRWLFTWCTNTNAT